MKTSPAPSPAQAILVGGLGFALAGSTVVAGRILGSSIPPFTTVVLSLVLALPVLAWVSQPLRKPSLASLGRAALQALFGLVLFRILLLEGTRTVDGLAAGLILGLGPLLLGLGGRILFRDRMGGLAWAGLGLATAGVILVRIGPGTQLEAKGALCLLGAVLGETVMSLLARTSPPGDAADNALWTIVAALAMTLPLATLETLAQGWPIISPASAWALAYYGLGPTALGYLAWSYAATRLDSGTLGIVNTAAPISAALLSAVVLKEGLGLARLAALLVLVGGLGLYAWGRRALE